MAGSSGGRSTGRGSPFSALGTRSREYARLGKLPGGIGAPSSIVATSPSTSRCAGPAATVSGKTKRPSSPLTTVSSTPPTLSRTAAPPIGRAALSETRPTRLVGCAGSRSRAWAVKSAGGPARPATDASTCCTPGASPRVHATWAWPVASVVATVVTAPSTVPSPCTAVKVTGTPAAGLLPSETHTESGRGRALSTSPLCPSPPPIAIWVAGAAVAEAQNSRVPAMSLLVTPTRLFPQPASLPRRQ